jgi:hypothetical protein
MYSDARFPALSSSNSTTRVCIAAWELRNLHLNTYDFSRDRCRTGLSQPLAQPKFIGSSVRTGLQLGPAGKAQITGPAPSSNIWVSLIQSQFRPEFSHGNM